MVKIKIEEVLEKGLKDKSSEMQQVANMQGVKLLQSIDSAEDAMILENLGSKHKIAISNQDYAWWKNLELTSEKYRGKVFHIDQIRELAIDYNLKFLNSKLFCGELDIQVTAKIKQFSKETGVMVNAATLGSHFFILAPEQMFSITVIKRPVDPVLFYRIDQFHYRLIHKWGNDFTVFRLFNGFYNQSFGRKVLMKSSTMLPIITLIISLLNISVVMPFYVTLVVSMIISFIIAGCSTSDRESNYSPSTWQSDIKIV